MATGADGAASAGTYTLYNFLGQPLQFSDKSAFLAWYNDNYKDVYDADNIKWGTGVNGQLYVSFYAIYDVDDQKVYYFDSPEKIWDHVNTSGHILQTSKNSTGYHILDDYNNPVYKDGKPLIFENLNEYLDAREKDDWNDSWTMVPHGKVDGQDVITPLSLDVDDYEDLGDFFTSTEPYYDEAGNLIATPSPDTGNNESADGTPSADKDTDSLTPGGETPDSVDPSTGNGSSDQKEDSGFQPESGNGSTGNSGSGNDSSNPAEGTTDSGSSDTPVEDNNTDNTDSGSTDDSSDGGDFSSGDDSSSSGSGESSSGSDNGGDTSSSPESTDSSADASPEPQTPVE